jgi:hypothetical protein
MLLRQQNEAVALANNNLHERVQTLEAELLEARKLLAEFIPSSSLSDEAQAIAAAGREVIQQEAAQ